MFTLKIDGVSYGVRFQYRPVCLAGNVEGSHEFFVEVDKTEIDESDSTRTVCQILLLNDEDRTSELICEGAVTCTLADTFRKSEGRQRSLTKALAAGAQGWHPSRDDRRKIWNAYFANHKDLRPKMRIPDACELCPNAS